MAACLTRAALASVRASVLASVSASVRDSVSDSVSAWYYREQQGDILLRKLDALPAGEQTITRKRLILAHGESGHSHVIEDDEAELIQIGERMLLKLTRAATVVHEEHGPVRLAPGIWEVGRVREFDWLSRMERQVMD